ncbi:MAG: ABC transporter ATP-binding protein [Dehalococcoidia bacterium]|nr:ABC transporter ATP-binding protein [Dehalococcoidia bacterium]
MPEPILRVRDLSVQYRGKEQTTYAVNGVSLDLYKGEVLALVGESGSGKTTVALSIPKLLPGEAQITSGAVEFQGQQLFDLNDDQLRTVRGRQISMIFQDPVAGLNPVISVGDQVAEILTSHLDISKKDAKRRVPALLSAAGLADAERVAKAYPFQLSGGMCQRVMIAIATALDPELIIADEPTSALDVTVQAQILAELDRLRRERGTSILLITHNFGVVAQIADRVAVVYGGRIVEKGTPETVMPKPLHPYTAALLATLPRLDALRGELPSIPGSPPEMTEPVEHCPFLPRCQKAMSRCRTEPAPPLEPDASGERLVACYNPMWIADDG